MYADFMLPIVTILFSVVVYRETLTFGKSTDPIGPGGWPRIVSLCLFALGIILLIKELLKLRHGKAKVADRAAGHTDEKSKDDVGKTAALYEKYKHWLAFGAMTIPGLLMRSLGFPVVCFVFLNTMALVLGMKNWKILLLVSVVASVSISFLFMSLLSMPLPMGSGIFRNVSQLFSNR